MLIPVRCFSCSKVIADKYKEYLKLKTENKNENDEQIFKKLKLKRYCCRRMFLSHIDLIEKLK